LNLPNRGRQALGRVQGEARRKMPSRHFVKHTPDGFLQPFKIIATFKNGSASPVRVILRNLQQHPRHCTKACFRDFHTTQRVTGVGVKPGGDEDKFRVELPTDWRNYIGKEFLILNVATT
jgi:hypothetical protein